MTDITKIDPVAEKINTSIIQTVRVLGQTFTVSVNQRGITISQPYSNSSIELNLKKGIKNKMTYPWNIFVEELDTHRDKMDAEVVKIISKKKSV
jgi:hypothetical protein